MRRIAQAFAPLRAQPATRVTPPRPPSPAAPSPVHTLHRRTHTVARARTPTLVVVARRRGLMGSGPWPPHGDQRTGTSNSTPRDNRPLVLVVDDEESYRQALASGLNPRVSRSSAPGTATRRCASSTGSIPTWSCWT